MQAFTPPPFETTPYELVQLGYWVKHSPSRHAPPGTQVVSPQICPQGCSLQDAASLSSGHTVPPHEASVMTVRVRVVVPPPHSAEQALHSLQSLTVQSVGATGEYPQLLPSQAAVKQASFDTQAFPQVPQSVTAPRSVSPRDRSTWAVLVLTST